MTMLWFFLVITWNGTVEVKHGYATEAACAVKREDAVRQYGERVREVTECIGYPLHRRSEP